MMTGSAEPACSLAMKVSRSAGAHAAHRLSTDQYCTASGSFANATRPAPAVRQAQRPRLAPAADAAYSRRHARDAGPEGAGRALSRPLGRAIRGSGGRSRVGRGDGGVAWALARAGLGHETARCGAGG